MVEDQEATKGEKGDGLGCRVGNRRGLGWGVVKVEGNIGGQGGGRGGMDGLLPGLIPVAVGDGGGVRGERRKGTWAYTRGHTSLQGPIYGDIQSYAGLHAVVYGSTRNGILTQQGQKTNLM